MKVKVDVSDVITENTALVLLANTGVIYSAQTGGLMCDHPEAEGFVLDVSGFGADLDDCSYGCHHIKYSTDMQGRLADAIKEYLINWKSRYNIRYNIRFDEDRKHELQEGWWPVLATYNSVEFKGYLHTGNCD